MSFERIPGFALRWLPTVFLTGEMTRNPSRQDSVETDKFSDGYNVSVRRNALCMKYPVKN